MLKFCIDFNIQIDLFKVQPYNAYTYKDREAWNLIMLGSTEVENMKESKSGITDYICLFVLSILFMSFLLLRYCHALEKASISQDKYAGGVQILQTDHHLADSAVSEDKAVESSLSLFRKQRESLWDFKARFYIDSFLAVLLKMAVFSCIIFAAFRIDVNADIFLQRVIHGFVHLQDGKKRQAFSL